MSLRSLIPCLSQSIYRDSSLIRRWRAARMLTMLKLVSPPPNARIVDFGGTPYLWELFDHQFEVTLVNLPGAGVAEGYSGRYRTVAADACDLRNVFDDNCFDLVFSNSVVEHVGDVDRQARFAAEAQRLARAYWVQTPSDWCPVEAHTGIPIYWRLPGKVRQTLLQRWRRELPVWCAMIESTTVLTRARLLSLFPGASLFVERRLGVEKSYAAYRPCGGVSQMH